MSCPDADAASTALNAAVAGPKSATTDGMTVESQPIPDLIAADKYLASKCAASSPTRGLRFNKLVPPGAS